LTSGFHGIALTAGKLRVPPSLDKIQNGYGDKMTVQTQVQYVSDEAGRAVGVIVPIELWREIESERETAYLLKSETMKKRLLEAKDRTGGMALEDARAQLGI